MCALSFSESVEPIIQQFTKRRLQRFAKSNNVNPDDVETVNEVSIDQLEKDFKHENGIKTRTFKNLTAEQKQAWNKYYDEHKQLKLVVKAAAPTPPTKSKKSKHVEHVIPAEQPPQLVVEPVKPKRSPKKQLTDDEIVEQILNTQPKGQLALPTPAEPVQKHHKRKHSAGKNDD